MLIFYGSIQIPFQISFDVNIHEITVLDRFIDLFFLVDLALNFRTGEIINGACYFDTWGTARYQEAVQSAPARACDGVDGWFNPACFIHTGGLLGLYAQEEMLAGLLRDA